MGLALRNEFGDIIKWKVVLIIELVILVVVGYLIFPQLIPELLKKQDNMQEPPEPSMNHNQPPRTNNFLEYSEFRGIVIGKIEATEEVDMRSMYSCGGRLSCIIIEEGYSGESYLVQYSAVLGEFQLGDMVRIVGIETKTNDIIFATSITPEDLDVPPELRR